MTNHHMDTYLGIQSLLQYLTTPPRYNTGNVFNPAKIPASGQNLGMYVFAQCWQQISDPLKMLVNIWR